MSLLPLTLLFVITATGCGDGISVSAQDSAIQANESKAAPNSQQKVVAGLGKSDLEWYSESVVLAEGGQQVALGKDEVASVRIEVTTKGNGLLTIQVQHAEPLVLKVFDTHLESERSEIFEGDMLNYWFEDLDSDGLLELVVRGRAKLVEEDGTVLSTRKVDGTYTLDREEGRWKKFEAAESDDAESGEQPPP